MCMIHPNPMLYKRPKTYWNQKCLWHKCCSAAALRRKSKKSSRYQWVFTHVSLTSSTATRKKFYKKHYSSWKKPHWDCRCNFISLYSVTVVPLSNWSFFGSLEELADKARHWHIIWIVCIVQLNAIRNLEWSCPPSHESYFPCPSYFYSCRTTRSA